MKFKSKFGYIKISLMLFFLVSPALLVNLDLRNDEKIIHELDTPNASEEQLYHVLWSQIDSSLGSIWDLAMSPSEDLYIICDGPSYGKSSVVKYSKDGNFQWEVSRDGEFRSIDLDSSNNVYVAGYTENYDMILEKFSSSGALQWSKMLDKSDYDYIYAITVDSLNNVYMAGISHDTSPSGWENKNIILVKYSGSGTYLWDTSLDIRDEDYCKGLTTDSMNNIYLCGNHRLYSTSDDIFIAKYSSSGTFQWVKNWGTAFQDDEAQDIVLDGSNNIYVTGSTYESTTNDDLILLKFNSAGTLQWSRRWGGSGLDVGYSIDLAADGDIFIAGGTYESSAGLYDILIAVYDSVGTMSGWSRWGGSQHDLGRGIAVSSSKQPYVGGDIDGDFCLLKYELAPVITINSPAPNSLYSFNAPSYNVDITDSNLLEKFYTVNDAGHYTFSGSTGTINQAAWDVCPHGPVSLKFYGRDPAGAVYNEVIIIKDIIAPDFEIISPTPFQVCTDVAPYYQLSTSDTDVHTIWYTLNGGVNIAASLTGYINQAAWNALENGQILIDFFMEDNLGNVNSKQVDVYKNYEIPLVSINSPTPNQVCGLVAPKYSISISSLWAIDKMWYSLNGGDNITITQTEGVLAQSEWALLGNGTINLKFYVENTLGNVGNAEVVIHKDIYYPFIGIYEPIENQIYGISAPEYNVSITSTTLDSKWYSLNNGDPIVFVDDIGKFDQVAWDACENGTVIVAFHANTTDGISNYKEIAIFKNIRCPIITILNPVKDLICGIETIKYDITIDETQLDKTWYSLNGGNNCSFVGLSGTIAKTLWDACGNGTVTIKFYANNTLGNLGVAEVSVFKDIYFPFMTIISPEFNQLCGITAPNYNISISSMDIDSIWYTLNDGVSIPIFLTYGSIDQPAWDFFSNESVIITFYTNNSYGQLNFKSVNVRKDTSTPSVTIISPQPYEVFGIDTLEFQVDITDPTLNASWYTLNGGPKYFFNESNEYLNPIAWEACGNGTVSISFFANNSLGNIGSKMVIVHRDIYFPFIDIIEPVTDQLVGLIAPNYNISVSSYAIDTMWYYLDSIEMDFMFSQVGTIDQSKWDLFGAGFITITFYVNNTYGQVNSIEVIVEKAVEVVEKNAYAIVIGISNYPGSDYDLSYCDDDALGVYNMLINDYNFKPENIIYIQDSSATKNNINSAFSQIESVIKPDDIFYFYYSGHGGAETMTSSPSTLYIQSPHPYPNYYDRTWWISSADAESIRVHFETFDLESGFDYLYLGDADIADNYYYQSFTGYGTNFWSNWIPVLNDNRIYLRMLTDSTVNNWGFRIDQIQVMRYSDPHYLCSYDSIPSSPSNYYLDTLLDSRLNALDCDNKYIILDSCNSGGMIPESQDTNRFIVTACKSGQFSMEVPSLNHGIFTYYLLNSLDNANDQDSDGVISMEECFSYISSRTRSYSASYGPGIQYDPQLFDGISGPAVLYPSIGSIFIEPIDNQLYYSFFLYGHGLLKTLNITVCSLSPSITIKTENLRDRIISPTGFGYYSGFVEFENGYSVGGIQLIAEIEGNRLIKINLTYGDSDGDGLTDIFEIFEGNGLDPNSNDTDSDGLSDYEEFYGPTDPLNEDSDSDGLIDGEEVNTYNTDPLNKDTDSDGLTDYEEVMIYGTNPSSSDSDSDGLSDLEELNIYSTDPLNPDCDSDDLLDGDEINVYLTNPFNNDTDSDNLSDGQEINIYFTNPISNDTDLDLISDYDELMIYNTNPLNGDSDFDGLMDFEEINDYGTDPLNYDTDSDTMPDGWEVENSLDPNIDDSSQDPDNDLLVNYQEFEYSTDPNNNDTDYDGLIDSEEIFMYETNPNLDDTDLDGLFDGEEINIYNTDPLDEDSDYDGLLDGAEVHIYQTNPLSGDTDLDLIPDKWEIDNLLNPLEDDSSFDPDNDGLINLAEYENGTNPHNSDTDGDGWTDGDEVLKYYTDPLDPDDYPIIETSPAVPGIDIWLLVLTISFITLISIRKIKHKSNF
jgi:hypothetical protein